MNAGCANHAEIFLRTYQQHKLKNNELPRHRVLRMKKVDLSHLQERKKILVMSNYLLCLDYTI